MSSKLNVVCAICDRTYSVPLEWIGKAANCKCGNSVPIEVPAMDDPAVPASEPVQTSAPPSASAPAPAPDPVEPPAPVQMPGAQIPSPGQPTLGGAAVLQAEVTSFTHSELDDDGEYSVNLKLRVTNTTSQNIEFLNSTSILLDGNGNPIHVSQSEDDPFIAPGDSEEI